MNYDKKWQQESQLWLDAKIQIKSAEVGLAWLDVQRWGDDDDYRRLLVLEQELGILQCQRALNAV